MKKSKINWHNIDWTKRTSDIAEELGVNPSIVSYYRNGMHKRKEKRDSYRINWSDVDWAKPNFIIAKEKDASPSAVIAARLAHAPEPLKHGRDIIGANAKAHVRDHFKGGKRNKAVATPEPPADHFLSKEEQHRNAQRRAAIIFTADVMANAYLKQVQDQDRMRNDMSNALARQTEAWNQVMKAAAARPAQPTAQPSWLKRKLIALRDWLFNLCVSVEKEANK